MRKLQKKKKNSRVFLSGEKKKKKGQKTKKKGDKKKRKRKKTADKKIFNTKESRSQPNLRRRQQTRARKKPLLCARASRGRVADAPSYMHPSPLFLRRAHTTENGGENAHVVVASVGDGPQSREAILRAGKLQ
eukprot:TRINITY_DN3297_c0_g1_i1.p2 TRINITY_DN3297_c0_g1~~TRINITY_DN3297_c0_g1_i1.p2  ORF type:complete len:133 (+),score=13.31 TRINITY_DN3297_c0_g1_i1:1-399(+)